ncbi:MAG: bifunctional diaminohydroxyphosphoribosylaminopyrimidine deaminase/5-amino-6-(5-phosphoribosylamino)uracil reductase RibD [Cloacibacillus sp.]
MNLPKSKIDEYYMSCALELAAQGAECSPNPRVGCVIVRDGQIIGRGWHKKCGGPHAEVNAVADACGDIEGADVYVTLEPCSHYGKTPPCADMLLEKRPARVITAMTDPNPKVAGAGLLKLRDAGIEVKNGVLEAECRYMNRGFIRRMTLSRPWVTIKCAASLDGRIALANGESKWITSEESRERVHAMRAENGAVLTGVGTVLSDDPKLTVRSAPGKNPLRVIVDRKLRTPTCAKILRGGALIFAQSGAEEWREEHLRMAGAQIERIEAAEDYLPAVLKKLCREGVNYLMVEAGPRVTSAFIASGLADELALFTAPKILGAGPSFSDFFESGAISDAPALKDIKYTKVGCDLLTRGVFKCSPDL